MIACHFVCVRAAFAFVFFVNASEKANNAKVIGYDVQNRFTEINCFTCFHTA